MWSRSISAGKSSRRLLAALFAIVAGAAVAQERPADTLRYPYVAALSRVSEAERIYFCAGALVAPRWILTAAHCFHDPRGRRIAEGGLWAEVGGASLKDVPDAAQVRFDRIFVHPDYDPASQANDLALVRLEQEAGPLIATIATARGAPAGNATMLGFGSFYEGLLAGRALSSTGAPAAQLSDQLRQIALPIVPCETENGARVCTGGGEGACLGDSGGPLITGQDDRTDRIVGIVSLGSGCAAASPRVVHTRVAAYAPWIERVIAGR
jgi:secreted trypsin-like serine protease